MLAVPEPVITLLSALLFIVVPAGMLTLFVDAAVILPLESTVIAGMAVADP